MKRIIAHWFVVFVTMFTFSSFLHANPETFTLDNSHTYVLWSIKHLGFSTQAGKWYANGQLFFDKEHPDQSRVKVTININDLVTGLPELDKHLKGKLFFDAEHFPTATFASNKVTVLNKNTADVQGMLTLHGVTKSVVLHVTFNKEGINPISNKMSVGFTATATIKRSDFGINALLPELGDQINLLIGAEAYSDKK